MGDVLEFKPTVRILASRERGPVLAVHHEVILALLATLKPSEAALAEARAQRRNK